MVIATPSRTPDRPPAPTDHDRRHPLRLVWSLVDRRLLIGLLVAALVMELGARVVERRDHVTTNVVEEHARRVDDGLRADVVTVGSSTAGAAMWSPLLESSGVACSAYSAYLAGPTMTDIARYTLDVVVPRLAPRQVVVGVTMREMKGGAPSVLDAALGTPSTGVSSFLEDHAALWRIRRTLWRPDELGDVLLGHTLADSDEHGHHLPSIDRVIADETEQHRTQEARAMAGWALGSDQLEALTGLIVALRDQGIHVVVADLPVTEEFVAMSPGGEADRRAFRDAIADLTDRLGAAFFDGDAGMFDTATQFADVDHLNRVGSIAFTQRLLESGLLSSGCSPQ